MTTKYDWYDIVKADETIVQGDFIKECPIIIPPSDMPDNPETTEVSISHFNVVIMSQSCDLAQGKLSLVLVCPVWALSTFEKKETYYKSREGKESLRRGFVHGYHLLNKSEIDEYNTDFQIVDFRSVFSVPYNFVINLARKRGNRLRLLPPYREHLSQSFSRFFMRVGLPVDIPPFK